MGEPRKEIVSHGRLLSIARGSRADKPCNGEPSGGFARLGWAGKAGDDECCDLTLSDSAGSLLS